MEKKCRECLKSKPIEDFYFVPKKIGKRRSLCKVCFGKIKTRPKCKDTFEKNLKSRYGIMRDDYEKMLVAQGGGCAICGGTEKLVVDHNHKTGVVRGILCFGCNVAIGHMLEDTARLRKAVAYLAQNSELK